MLELDDGTQLVQTSAILNYLGATHNLRPVEPIKIYHGEMATEYMWNDFFSKNVPTAIFAKEDREAKMADLTEKAFPAFLTNFDKILGADKYIVGDSLTIYDCQLGGFFTNLVCNPNSKDPEAWAAAYEKNASERVKKYVEDFKAEMKPYLDGRCQTSTL